MREDEDSYRMTRAARPSVSLHPAFPLVVAVWFAALLGLGSLILPLALIERAVLVSGLANIVPAAAPPLGMTARGGLALAAGMLGALAGIVIALQVRRAALAGRPARTARIVRGAGEARGPRPAALNAHADLGGNGLDDIATPLSARRRALAIEPEAGTSDYFDFAPLPGERRFGRSDPADGDESEDAGAAYRQADEVADPLELAAFEEDGAAVGDARWRPADLAETAEFEPWQEDEAGDDGAPAPASEVEAAPPPHAHPAPPMEDTLETPAFPAAPSPRRFDVPPFGEDAPATPAAAFGPVTPLAPADAAPFSPPPLAVAAAAGDAEPPLPELLERLGSTIERYRSLKAALSSRAVRGAATPPPPLRAIVPESPAAPEDVAAATSAWFAAKAAPAQEHEDAGADWPVAPPADEAGEPSPPAMRPEADPPTLALVSGTESGAGEGDEAEVELARLAASLSLPLGASPARPADPHAETAPVASLASLRVPGRAAFATPVRIEVDAEEDEGDGGIAAAVQFPHQLPHARRFDPPPSGAAEAVTSEARTLAPPATDDALREALLGLQRFNRPA